MYLERNINVEDNNLRKIYIRNTTITEEVNYQEVSEEHKH